MLEAENKNIMDADGQKINWHYQKQVNPDQEYLDPEYIDKVIELTTGKSP